MTTIVSIYNDAHAARQAIEQLRESAIDIEDISFIARSNDDARVIRDDAGLTTAESSAAGALIGGLIGAAALTIPGLGPLIVGGALLGGLAGAAVGGIAGTLSARTGIAESEARYYESLVSEGKALVAVKAAEADAVQIRHMLVSAGAESLYDSSVSGQPARANPSIYDDSGRPIRIGAEYMAHPGQGVTYDPGLPQIARPPGEQPSTQMDVLRERRKDERRA